MSFSRSKTASVPADVHAGVPESETPAWQARALDRSLADTRARSVARLSQFVAAARSLAEETGSSAFTVQQVVARSGQSLKSFYRYFESKDDLLLALLEEDVAVGAIFLRALIDVHDDPVARVREWIVGLFGLMSSGDQGYVSVLVREHQRLSETRADQMDVAVAPFVEPLIDELERAAQLGVVRAGDPRRDARLVFQLSLAAIHEMVSARDLRDPNGVAEHLWDFCWGGLRGRDESSD
jgi:AcrR family transcriptional regulator